MTKPFSRHWRSLVSVAALLALSAPALAQGLDYAQALQQAQEASGQVRNARMDAQAKDLKAEALAHLGGPALSLSGFSGRVATTFNLDTSPLANAAGSLGSVVPGGLSIPPIPNAVSVNRTFNLHSLGLSANWPIYTGGRLEAIHGLEAGKADEARAEARDVEDKMSTTVAQRYFSLQLATHAVQLRSAAAKGIADHQRAAQRLEATGLIATAERLKADVALDGARRDLARSQSDLEIAQVALTRLLGAASPAPLTTPLFVNSASVGTLQSFIDAGLAHNPAWDKIASKRTQADQALKLQTGGQLPTVLAIGNYNFNRSSDKLVQPNWAVGILVSVPLIDRIDRGKMKEAAILDQQRVSALEEQAQRDVPTLIESQWRALQNARAQFLSMDSTIRLARENLRLQTVSFQQSQSTSLDLTDARLNLLKVDTERVQAAYDYVMALARLLEASGQPQRLAEFAQNADIKIALPAE